MIDPSPDFIHPDLAKYDIDPETGFVILKGSDLPPYYEAWNKIISSLPDLINHKQVKAEIDNLAVLSTESFVNIKLWRRAYVTLGYIIQAYIWEDQENPRDIIPPCLSVPFLDICDHLGIRPVLSYAGLCLWNCVLKEHVSMNSMSTLNNIVILSDFSQIRSYASFTGTRDEDAFNLCPVMIEACCAKLIQPLLEIISTHAQSRSDLDLYPTLLTILPIVVSTLEEIISLLPILNSTCHPKTFFHCIRPFLSGSTSLPNGITFNRSPTSTTVNTSCAGGSAAQSPFFQFLDHVLGITHSPTLSRPQILETRNYMSKPQRIFLEFVDTLPSIPDILAERISHKDNNADTNSNTNSDTEIEQELKQIQALLRQCIDTLRKWRNAHINLVARYIIAPAREDSKDEVVAVKGTAGTSPMVFLKGVRDETVSNS